VCAPTGWPVSGKSRAGSRSRRCADKTIAWLSWADWSSTDTASLADDRCCGIAARAWCGGVRHRVGYLAGCRCWPVVRAVESGGRCAEGHGHAARTRSSDRADRWSAAPSGASVDVIVVLALGGALAVRETFAGAMIAVMLGTGRLLEARANTRAPGPKHAGRAGSAHGAATGRQRGRRGAGGGRGVQSRAGPDRRLQPNLHRCWVRDAWTFAADADA
jgi:hypothetical protein